MTDDLYCCACDELIVPGEDVYWEFPEDADAMCDECYRPVVVARDRRGDRLGSVMAAPRHTTFSLAALVSEIRKAQASFGDATGAWASTTYLADALWTDYGRVRHVLDDLAGEGVVRRHPSGADFWQIADGGA